MVSEPEKIEEFDDLDDDSDAQEPLGKAAGALEEAGSSPGEDSSPGEMVEDTEAAEEVEDLEPLIDEAPEMMFSRESQEMREGEVLVKYCLFCREVIPAEAIACKHCGHVVHIFEGAVFKQLYWFFWGAVFTLVGTLLPYYNGEMSLVTACTTFAGSFYLIFSLLLIAAMAFSIYSKRLVMSPVFLMFIPAVLTWWTVVEHVAAAPDFNWYNFLYDFDAIKWLAKDVGAGLLLIMFGSTLVALTFIVSLFSAVFGKRDDKPAQRSAPKGKGRRR